VNAVPAGRLAVEDPQPSDQLVTDLGNRVVIRRRPGEAGAPELLVKPLGQRLPQFGFALRPGIS
jgi:hypothetical protein